jgi:hypothetical protein
MSHYEIEPLRQLLYSRVPPCAQQGYISTFAIECHDDDTSPRREVDTDQDNVFIQPTTTAHLCEEGVDVVLIIEAALAQRAVVVLLILLPKRFIQHAERLRLLHRSVCDVEDAKRSLVCSHHAVEVEYTRLIKISRPSFIFIKTEW